MSHVLNSPLLYTWQGIRACASTVPCTASDLAPPCLKTKPSPCRKSALSYRLSDWFAVARTVVFASRHGSYSRRTVRYDEKVRFLVTPNNGCRSQLSKPRVLRAGTGDHFAPKCQSNRLWRATLASTTVPPKRNAVWTG